MMKIFSPTFRPRVVKSYYVIPIQIINYKNINEHVESPAYITFAKNGLNACWCLAAHL